MLFYVGTATTAVETDSLYAYNPYTGAAYNVLPSRYILSPVSCISCRDQPVMRRASSSHCGTYCFSGGICFSGICGAFSVQPHILQGKGWRTGNFYDPLCRDPVVLRIFGIQFRNFYNGQDLAGKSCAGRGIFTIFYFCSVWRFFMQEKPEYPWSLAFLANGACCLFS